MKNYYVYILANNHNNVLYIGVTNDLARRVSEHKLKLIPGFTKKYNVDRLVYYEHFYNIKDAISRETSFKGLTRRKKDLLITSFNKELKDLSDEWGWNQSLS